MLRQFKARPNEQIEQVFLNCYATITHFATQINTVWTVDAHACRGPLHLVTYFRDKELHWELGI